MGRKSDYSTDMFKQMQEVMERLSKMEAANTQNQKKLKEANANISSIAVRLRSRKLRSKP